MANLNLKANTPEEQIILKHLIPQVSEVLAEKINNGVRIQKDGKTLINKKDISTFMDYLYEEARKRIPEKARHGKQCVGMEGEDILGIAITLKKIALKANFITRTARNISRQSPLKRTRHLPLLLLLLPILHPNPNRSRS